MGISTGAVLSILTDDLALQRVSMKFVLKLLTMEQKQLHLEVAQDMLDSANSDPEFLNIVTTGGESWVYGYDPETKAQSFSQKITMRRVLHIHSHSHAGCIRLMLSAGGKKSTYVHEGTLHLPTTAHLLCFISFRGKKSHVGYFLNSPRSHIPVGIT